MKVLNLRSAVLLVGSFFLAACSATPGKEDAKQPAVVFAKPLTVVHQAAVGALVSNGFEVQKDQPTYIEGMRPHKVGLAVGSGGESAGVWLEQQGTDKTAVTVSTAKSLVGIVGQRSWDADILAQIQKTLSGAE